jgi:Leucine-rich repeat (LRR) protein
LKDATWLEAIICYNNPKITSRGVQILQKLPKLKRLQFGHTERITDDVIKGLSQIKSLHNIKIVDCNSSGIHFSYLKSLPAFDRLTLKSVALDNVSLSQACELPHALSFENIGKNLDWQLLKKFRGDNLIFKFCALEPQMFAAMGKAENLQGLFVEHCSLDPRCMHELKSARKLVVLSLHNTNVTDECVSEITNLPSLRSIDLSDTKITGKSLKLLERLHSLRLLLVWGNTPIKNSAALQDFREHRPEVRLASTSEEGKQLRAFGL